ncbi:MAG: chromate resistance protein, partial [Comamonas sp.]|nr:chromate resistance protein [Comamonas sp.]
GGRAPPALPGGGFLVNTAAGGGGPPPEAAGIESVLAGLRETLTQDDQLLTAASAIFDGLLASFDKGVPST